MDSPSKLFGRAGYISIKEYVEDITHMFEDGPWKLPLRFGDRAQLFFLKMVIRFSWFADNLYIVHPSNFSPAYVTLLSYMQKKQLFDSITERNLHSRGYFSYYLEKKAIVRGQTWVMSGQGVAEDKATAFSKALGEMIERAVSGMYDTNKDIVVASPDELMKRGPMIYPPKHHRFLSVQKEKFEELRHSSADPIAWVEGTNLMTKEKTYIPRQITSWFSENRNAKKNVLAHATTNGAAGYFTKTGAVLRGLLEVIQRDAFLVHWLTMIPPRVIDQKTLPEKIREKIRQIEILGLSLHVLDVTSLAIPSVFIAAINTYGKVPQVVLSGAAALTFEEAIENALREIIVIMEMFYYADGKAQSGYASIEPKPFVSNLGKVGRQLYWQGTHRVERFKWFISGESVSYSDACKGDIYCGGSDMDRLKKCLRILKDLGKDYYPTVYYPKNKIQDEIGFYIAQVYIPKAFPLYLVERYGTFESDRLQEFALSKGVSDWQLNPLPHMFS